MWKHFKCALGLERTAGKRKDEILVRVPQEMAQTCERCLKLVDDGNSIVNSTRGRLR
jgi:hypothetical protein